MTFLGRYPARLDDKFRVPIPSKYRDRFDAPAYLTSGNGPYIAVYTKETFDAASAEVKEIPANTEAGQKARRKFFGDANDVTKDLQGRLLIPPLLRTRAGLVEKGEVMIVGAGEWFEIWDAETWQQTQNET